MQTRSAWTTCRGRLSCSTLQFLCAFDVPRDSFPRAKPESRSTAQDVKNSRKLCEVVSDSRAIRCDVVNIGNWIGVLRRTELEER